MEQVRQLERIFSSDPDLVREYQQREQDKLDYRLSLEARERRGISIGEARGITIGEERAAFNYGSADSARHVPQSGGQLDRHEYLVFAAAPWGVCQVQNLAEEAAASVNIAVRDPIQRETLNELLNGIAIKNVKGSYACYACMVSQNVTMLYHKDKDKIGLNSGMLPRMVGGKR